MLRMSDIMKTETTDLVNQKLRFRAFRKYMDIFVGDLEVNEIFENIKIFRKSRDIYK